MYMLKLERVNFIKYNNYFRKLWLNFKKCWGENLSEINFTKTNNLCEIYHRRLNDLISIKNPKISCLDKNLFLLS